MVTRRWARSPRCVGLARAELRKALADWDLASIEDVAALVLSELLTNAVVHAHVSPGRKIQTCFRRHEVDGVRIAVDDAYEGLPVRRAPGGEGGRGLVLVDGLADSWGVSDRAGAGKSVWAVLSAPGGKGRA
ncbi:ATP-binding protein [Streptomyces stramineus]|uniref:ATP-binding protein n=1 Tax=Streptomyces TaxID=1883 RepID=UPI0031D98D2D